VPIEPPQSNLQNFKWWQTGIIYQIYPRSFQDSNDDGVGDLPGILQRLDYLQQLEIDAIWISPIYPSPMADFGYDVADYVEIDPRFGTLADFDRLVHAAHARHLKVVLDLVPNHTSDEHPWFLESGSSRVNPKRDWYIWRDPAPGGGAPNNWLSVFGGSAWQFDEPTGQYYLHSFDVHQPDLNYRHPAVLPAMLDVMRFWLERGVDGFRVDVITRLLKDAEFRDAPSNPHWDGVDPYNSLLDSRIKNVLEVHAIAKEFRKLLDAYPDRVLIGETYLPMTEVVKYYGDHLDECHLPFNFELIFLKWKAKVIRDYVNSYEANLPRGARGNWVLGNHDRARVASRVGTAQARVANMLLLTLRGTPTTYYGEEIGMLNGDIPLDCIQDPPALKQPALAHIIGRDPERTPMQWDASPNARFARAGVKPWLPVAANYVECNIARQTQDPHSMLNLYRALARLRRAESSLTVGNYASIEARADDVLAYTRAAPDADRFLIVLNLGAQEHLLDLSQVAVRATIAMASDMHRHEQVDLTHLALHPNEGLVLRLVG
jgi:alpha-glucosidase